MIRIKKFFNFNEFLISVIVFSGLALTGENLNYYVQIALAILSIIQILNIVFIKRKQVKCSYFVLWFILIYIFLYLCSSSIYKIIFAINFIYIYVYYISLSEVELIKTTYKISVICSLIIIFYLFLNDSNIIRILTLGSSVNRIGMDLNINPNQIAECLSFFSISVFYYIVEKKKKSSVIIYALQIGFILLTASKNALIVVLIPWIIYLLYFIAKFDIKKVVLLTLLLSISIFMIFNNDILYGLIGKRLIGMYNTLMGVSDLTADYSTMERTKMLIVAKDMISQKPLLGWGYGAFSMYGGFSNQYTHNNYYELLVSFGAAGFFIYYSLYLYIIAKIIYIRKKIKNKIYPIVYLVANIIFAFSIVNFDVNYINYLVLLYIYVFLTNYKTGKLVKLNDR